MSSDSVERIYAQRFTPDIAYRRAVWRVLTARFFQRFIPSDATVLDLGCGYGEFINQIRCGAKFAMDLNADSPAHLDPAIRFIHQDCSMVWPLPEGSLDAVFTSNFFEHLPSKEALGRALEQIYRCLKPGGSLIAMGPNIRIVPGAYWDFWDHYLPLTEHSLSEGLRNRGFEIRLCRAAFLPYTMVHAPHYPPSVLRLYLALPFVWRFFGKQFLVIAVKSP